MSLADDRHDLAEALSAGCTGWRAFDYIPDQINPPVLLVDFEVGPQITFGAVGEAKHNYTLKVKALAQRDDSRSAQAQLDKLRDPTEPTSLWQVVEASTVGDYLQVTRASETQMVDAPGDSTSYLMIEFDVEAVI